MQCDWVLCRIALGFHVAANSDHCTVFGGQTRELHELLSSITDLTPVIDSAMRNWQFVLWGNCSCTGSALETSLLNSPPCTSEGCRTCSHAEEKQNEVIFFCVSLFCTRVFRLAELLQAVQWNFLQNLVSVRLDWWMLTFFLKMNFPKLGKAFITFLVLVYS